MELPPACEFGVERDRRAGLSNADKIRRSNREVARLFCDMLSAFSPKIAVLFPTEDEAAAARSVWGALFRGPILSVEVPEAQGFGKLRSRRFSAAEQQQALLATDGVYVPDDTEVRLTLLASISSHAMLQGAPHRRAAAEGPQSKLLTLI